MKKRNKNKKPVTKKTSAVAQPKKSPLGQSIASTFQGSQQNAVVHQVETHEINHFQGPIPPPETLKEYDKLNPGFSLRILGMAEKEQEHRHQCEAKALKQQVENHKARNRETARGQHYGLAIGITAIVAGTVLALYGNAWPGGVIGSGGVIGLVAVFIFGRSKHVAEPPPPTKKK
ncbi:DUF2335 domain-containing protein [Thiolapillus sp.]|uniref:DUF2335 domain-containing protein n=1 Tax=Thiolapillus sp. TaxID=2017437 RepID=UPI003AF53084